MNQRPRYLNPFVIRLPLPGWVSILHRLSGVLLFAALPWVLYGFQLSLQGPAGFARVTDWFAHPFVKLLTTLLVWAGLHHFLAGLRLLALDAHWGTALPAARRSGLAVLLGGAVLTLVIGGTWLW
jgi:succinate dehydrogenase / fumarate reductase, cytochrome b subunit